MPSKAHRPRQPQQAEKQHRQRSDSDRTADLFKNKVNRQKNIELLNPLSAVVFCRLADCKHASSFMELAHAFCHPHISCTYRGSHPSVKTENFFFVKIASLTKLRKLHKHAAHVRKGNNEDYGKELQVDVGPTSWHRPAIFSSNQSSEARLMVVIKVYNENSSEVTVVEVASWDGQNRPGGLDVEVKRAQKLPDQRSG
ncbi:hypothetical protein T310_4946 [Rasamsonia emersonii CBS 393.64]|uniref:Uncharacterized protein n=1 Tax=Rasamsonia emersonii (strain ATCC 16479 / CBS 393.64 / IMI 116815) TaxID=1408163 RepID=A0A0F4YSF4_RASE3|nr:hypothetical protein T310_4946 [Rasamsonia emersonii CBS 393.64]KKA21040.1 hypothetical protein T310_4946 [Rasamsonia emersonii CBS 393.64]